MIHPAQLTEFTSEQLEMFIYEIGKLEEKADEEFLLMKAEAFELLKVQMSNALVIVKEQEKIYQS